MADYREGNQCLFILFIIFNCVLIVGALAIIGLSVYLFLLEGIHNIFDWGCLAIGVILSLLALSAFKLKKSPGWLWCYLALLSIVLTLMTVQAVMYFIMKNELVNNVAQPFADEMNVDLPTAKKILNHNLQWVGLGFLICTGLVFLTFSLGCCYRRSTIEETQDHADGIIADIRKEEK